MGGAEVSIRGQKASIIGVPDVNVTDRTARILGQLTNGIVTIDPRDRNWTLSSITDSILATISGTPDVNVTDRANRLLGITYGSQGQQLQQKAGTFELLTDPVDRSNRLLGITYGSQGQQLQQRGVTFDILTQLRTGGVEYDARQIRSLLSTDIVTPYGSQTQPLQQRAISNELLVQLTNAGIQIDPRDRNWDLNFATDQVDVSGSSITVTNVPTNPINNFNIGNNIDSGLSSTHTYTATGNFRLSSIEVSASGAMKIEIKSGISGLETTKMVAFTTGSNLTLQLDFKEELQLTIGQTIQVIRTNRETQTMDVFSTILGFNT